MAIPPNLFYRLVLACKKQYCSGDGAIFHRFHVWESAALVVNTRDKWAVALLLDHHDNKKRYHRAVSVVEWRADVPGDLLAPPRFPQRDALLRIFQHEIWRDKYPQMAWEVRILDMGAVMWDPVGEWDHDGVQVWRAPELVEGGEHSLHKALGDKRKEQERLRGLEPDGFLAGGGGSWPSARLMATLALEGNFGPRMEEKVSNALSSDLPLLQSLHSQVVDPTHALFAESSCSVPLYGHLLEPMRQWVDLMLDSSVGLVGAVVAELASQSGRQHQEMETVAQQLREKGEQLRTALVGEVPVAEELCREIKALVAKWETAMRTLSRAAPPADAGPTLADVLSKLDVLCEAMDRPSDSSHRDLLQEVEETKRALLSAIESQGRDQREDSNAMAKDLSTLLSKADALTRSLSGAKEEAEESGSGSAGVDTVQQEQELRGLVREILDRLRNR